MLGTPSFAPPEQLRATNSTCARHLSWARPSTRSSRAGAPFEGDNAVNVVAAVLDKARSRSRIPPGCARRSRANRSAVVCKKREDRLPTTRRSRCVASLQLRGVRTRADGRSISGGVWDETLSTCPKWPSLDHRRRFLSAALAGGGRTFESFVPYLCMTLIYLSTMRCRRACGEPPWERDCAGSGWSGPMGSTPGLFRARSRGHLFVCLRDWRGNLLTFFVTRRPSTGNSSRGARGTLRVDFLWRGGRCSSPSGAAMICRSAGISSVARAWSFGRKARRVRLEAATLPIRLRRQRAPRAVSHR